MNSVYHVPHYALEPEPSQTIPLDVLAKLAFAATAENRGAVGQQWAALAWNNYSSSVVIQRFSQRSSCLRGFQLRCGRSVGM